MWQSEKRLAQLSIVRYRSGRQEGSDGRIAKADLCKHFECPITQEVLREPVLTADGHTYEGDEIRKWLETKNTSPATNVPLPNKNLIPQHMLKSVIKNYCAPEAFEKPPWNLDKNSTVLSLHNNEIDDESAKAIAEEIRASGSSLAELYLFDNKIGDEGAKALAEAISASGSLAQLVLSFNKIGDEGAKALAEAIRASDSMAELNLAGNSIGDEGAKALAAAVGASGSMAELDLRFNKIGDEGAKAIAEAIRASRSLALKKLRVPYAIKKHAELMAACKSKGVELV